MICIEKNLIEYLKRRKIMSDEWKSFRENAKIIEEEFAKNLENPVWANGHQDRR